ncbi:hypothetical protein KEJ27_03215 [Candidatus Bathyarchaeota archaeon]|nr:hypothetical protein [Candidatus Bathyarchaeota archaeon]MBS7613554.1 hypothetical protein [Candidatus Bathyarchaeota archaeon]MBS7618363.1 hypothetical protein [Candidatus Bathyarchaeota archaeon]
MMVAVRTKEFRGMKCRQVGSSGLWTSEVGLGLWKWGGPSYDGSRVGEHEGFKILDFRILEKAINRLAIACLLSHSQVSSVIAGVTKMEQLEDDAQARKVELT